MYISVCIQMHTPSIRILQDFLRNRAQIMQRSGSSAGQKNALGVYCTHLPDGCIFFRCHLGVYLVSTLREGNLMMSKWFRILIFSPLLIFPGSLRRLRRKQTAVGPRNVVKCFLLLSRKSRKKEIGDRNSPFVSLLMLLHITAYYSILLLASVSLPHSLPASSLSQLSFIAWHARTRCTVILVFFPNFSNVLLSHVWCMVLSFTTCMIHVVYLSIIMQAKAVKPRLSLGLTKLNPRRHDRRQQAKTS